MGEYGRRGSHGWRHYRYCGGYRCCCRPGCWVCLQDLRRWQEQERSRRSRVRSHCQSAFRRALPCDSAFCPIMTCPSPCEPPDGVISTALFCVPVSRFFVVMVSLFMDESGKIILLQFKCTEQYK